MKLRSVEIANCRSIESAKFTELMQTNVLVGRNNSGKSAFFRALWHVSQKLQGRSVDWHRTLRNANPGNRLGVRLRFQLDETDRKEFFRGTFESLRSNEERFQALVNSPFARHAEFYASTVAMHPNLMHLYETKLLGEDGKWAIIHRLESSETSQNPVCILSQLDALDAKHGLTGAAMSLDQAPKIQASISFTDWDGRVEPAFHLQRAFVRYFKNAFFFQPSRRSEDIQAASAVANLAPDGSNLPQVLLRIRTNHDQQFDAVVDLIKAAIPDIGQLQTPMDDNRTRIGFRHPNLREPIPLLDMGTGVQQLLMVAVLLATTGEETSIFMEEPELNLHPGAQRYLLSRLQSEHRQVFMTTHSPVLVNVQPSSSLHRVRLVDAKTTAELVKNPADLAEALGLIGAQNSDVLLSDAILFVEGPSDRRVLVALSRVLGASLEERGITVLTLGGTDGGQWPLRIRQEVLQGISRKSHVAHLFVIDRDERTDEDLNALVNGVGNALRVLERRELENYLLVPRAIAVALGEALHLSGRSMTEDLSVEEIDRRISAIADELRGTVLLKRIRTACSRLSGGFFPRETISELQGAENEESLADHIKQVLRARWQTWLDRASIEGVVAQERKKVKAIWESGSAAILAAVPGADVLDRLFDGYGLRYDKSTDGARIARAMVPEEIDAQLKGILSWKPV